MDGYPECICCPRQLPTFDDARLWRLGWEWTAPYGWCCAGCIDRIVQGAALVLKSPPQLRGNSELIRLQRWLDEFDRWWAESGGSV